MAVIPGYRDAVLYSSSGTLTAGANAKVYVYSQGCFANQPSAVSASAGATCTVFNIGSFVALDYVKVGSGGTVRQLSAASGTTLTFAAGTTFTPSVGTHFLNIGTASDGSASKATIYASNDSVATAVISAQVTADSNGNFQWFASAGTYSMLVQNSSAVDLFVVPEVTIPLLTDTGTAPHIVSLTNTAADLAIGGNTTAAAMYMDESTEILYVGGASGSFATIDGGNNDAQQPILTLTSNQATGPQVKLKNSANITTTLAESGATSDKTVTLPNVTGTLTSDAGTTTMTGARTLSGNNTYSGTATITGAATLSSTVTISGALTASNLLADFNRLYATQGITIGTTDLTVGSGWGTTASKAVTAGGKAARGQFTITANGTGLANPATVALAFAVIGGVFNNVPYAQVQLSGGTGVTTTAVPLSWTITNSALTISYLGVPTAAATYIFDYLIIG